MYIHADIPVYTNVEPKVTKREHTPIVQIRKSPVDKLLMLWAICLVKHYQEINKTTSPNNLIAEFGEYHWQLFRNACELADQYKLINAASMQLTPKGLVACQQWQQISDQIFSP